MTSGPWPDLLRSLQDVLVVRGPGVAPGDLPAGLTGPATTQRSLTGPRLTPTPAGASPVHDAVVLVVPDRLGLRQVVGAARLLPSSVRVGCLLLHSSDPLLTAGRPSWPRVVSLTALGDPCLTWVELAGPLPAGTVVADLARRTSPAHLQSAGWPVLAFERGSPRLWSPGDPGSLVGSRSEVTGTTQDYPPDLVVLDDASPPSSRRPVDHPVVGRLVEDLRLARPGWDDPAVDTLQAWGEGSGGLALGGLDERVLSPTGFLQQATQGPAELLPAAGSDRVLVVTTADGPVSIDGRRGVGETQVAALRAVERVHLTWRGTEGPVAYARVVAGLALAGVPLSADPAPGWAQALLHPEVLAAVTDGGPQDALAREVASIRLRRAAYRHHSGAAWRRAVARERGLQQPRPPRVTVLVATRRPEMVGFALRQVARQRGSGGGGAPGPDLELVLAAHGHRPDPGVLEAFTRGTGIPATLLEAPADQPFGAVLDEAAARAGGDVLLKMDDDDWYGPDFVADLLAARAYSGADVVGTAPEFVYVEPLDLTVRRRHTTRALPPGRRRRHDDGRPGGVRGRGRLPRHLRSYVDAGLLQAVVAAGGSVYCAHGHGYLLRRTAGGHTWDPGLGYFVSRARRPAQWRGFRPSPLLEMDPVDVTVPSSGSAGGPEVNRQPNVVGNDWTSLEPAASGRWEPTLRVDRGRARPRRRRHAAASAGRHWPHRPTPRTCSRSSWSTTAATAAEPRAPELSARDVRTSARLMCLGAGARPRPCRAGTPAATSCHWLDADMLPAPRRGRGAAALAPPARPRRRAGAQAVRGRRRRAPRPGGDRAGLVPRAAADDLFRGRLDLPARLGGGAPRARPPSSPPTPATPTWCTWAPRRPSVATSTSRPAGWTRPQAGRGRRAGVPPQPGGAVFVPDREARSWHLGRSTLMGDEDGVNRYNRPFVTDRVADLRHWRTRGRSLLGAVRRGRPRRGRRHLRGGPAHRLRPC